MRTNFFLEDSRTWASQHFPDLLGEEVELFLILRLLTHADTGWLWDGERKKFNVHKWKEGSEMSPPQFWHSSWAKKWATFHVSCEILLPSFYLKDWTIFPAIDLRRRSLHIVPSNVSILPIAGSSKIQENVSTGKSMQCRDPCIWASTNHMKYRNLSNYPSD